MSIARFGPTSEMSGRTITYDPGESHFLLEGGGYLTAEMVLKYDEDDDLVWAYDGAREWVADRTRSRGRARREAMARADTEAPGCFAGVVGLLVGMAASVVAFWLFDVSPGDGALTYVIPLAGLFLAFIVWRMISAFDQGRVEGREYRASRISALSMAREQIAYLHAREDVMGLITFAVGQSCDPVEEVMLEAVSAAASLGPQAREVAFGALRQGGRVSVAAAEVLRRCTPDPWPDVEKLATSGEPEDELAALPALVVYAIRNKNEHAFELLRAISELTTDGVVRTAACGGAEQVRQALGRE